MRTYMKAKHLDDKRHDFCEYFVKLTLLRVFLT